MHHRVPPCRHAPMSRWVDGYSGGGQAWGRDGMGESWEEPVWVEWEEVVSILAPPGESRHEPNGSPCILMSPHQRHAYI